MVMRFAAAAAVLLACGTASAQVVTGPYVSLGGGVNLQQNEIVTAAPEIGFHNNLAYRFDAGAAGEASIGYGLGNGLRLEIEGDFLTNHVKGLTGTPEPARAGGYEQKYGGFANVLYDFDFGLPVTPYVGVGAGGQIESLHGVSYSIIGATPLPPPPPGTLVPTNKNESVGGFAYQSIAGVSFPVPVIPGLSLTAEYHFIGLLDPLPAFHRAVERRAFVPCKPPLFCIGPQTVVDVVNRHFGNNENHSLMLGLRYAFGAPPLPTPAPTAVVPPPPPQVVDYTWLVFFDWDRADLSARARAIVAEAAQRSAHDGITRIDVNGYTDLSGTAAYNRKLSLRRARAVEMELVRDGVKQDEIGIHGYGESNPLVPTAAGVREPQNRRVEIIFH